jgi:hypothetical protein
VKHIEAKVFEYEIQNYVKKFENGLKSFYRKFNHLSRYFIPNSINANESVKICSNHNKAIHTRIMRFPRVIHFCKTFLQTKLEKLKDISEPPSFDIFDC